MTLTLNVDGKQVSQPGDADIAQALEALDKRTGFFAGPGISIIERGSDEAQSLTATGTAGAGFLLSYKDGDPDCEYNTGLEQSVSLDETIRIFQAYARGDDWGKSNFKWERTVLVEGDTPRLIKRLLVIGFLGYLAYLVVRKLAAN